MRSSKFELRVTILERLNISAIIAKQQKQFGNRSATKCEDKATDYLHRLSPVDKINDKLSSNSSLCTLCLHASVVNADEHSLECQL